MGHQDFLDFARVDVESTTNDHVFDAVDNIHVAVFAHCTVAKLSTTSPCGLLDLSIFPWDFQRYKKTKIDKSFEYLLKGQNGL